MSRRKLRVGMVGGGGPANFFGAPHRRAILMDNSAELTAGALRSKPEESIESARELFFARGYGDWQSMIEGRGRAPGRRADRLRDDRHPQRRPLRPGRRRRRGRDRRPLREAADDHARRGQAAPAGRRVEEDARSSSPTPTPASRWSCSPRSWSRTARSARSARSRPGIPRAGWPRSSKAEGQKQASWRVDPAKAGASGCGGDIGTHAYEFVRFVAGLSATRRPGPAHVVRQGPGPRRRFHRPGRAGQRRDRHHRRLADHHRRPERQRLPRQRDQGDARMVDHRPQRPQALRGRPAGQALPPRGRIRLLPRLDQALHPRPVRPPRGLPRGPGEPPPHAPAGDPGQARREGPRARSSTPGSSTAWPAWRSSRPPSPARSRAASGSRSPKVG